MYECSHLQLGIKADFKTTPGEVKFDIYWGNKTSSTAFTDVRPQLQLEGYADSLVVKQLAPASASFTVQPGAQLPCSISISAKRPFSGVPSFAFLLTANNTQHRLALKLPLVMARLCRPTSLQPSQFITAWKKYGNELVVKRRIGAVADVTLMKTVLTSPACMNLFHVKGVEKTPNDLFVGGTFQSSTVGSNGKRVTPPCLVRVETKPNAKVFRMTVHSGHLQVSHGLVSSITKMLGAQEL